MKLQEDVLLGYLLQEDAKEKINVNAYEFVNGSAETLLDYLYYLLNDPEKQKSYSEEELYELVEILLDEYDAKTAKELGLQ